MKSWTVTIGATLVGLAVFLAPALFFLPDDFKILSHAWAVDHEWVATDAYVLGSRLDRIQMPRPAGNNIKARGCEQMKSVFVSYEYEYAGRRYVGSRFGFRELSECIERADWPREWHRYFSEMRQAGKPITIYVDPDHPGEAMVYRSIRWDEMVFHLIFLACAAFAGLIAFAVISAAGASDIRER